MPASLFSAGAIFIYKEVTVISDKFKSLTPDKQGRIINAALAEFARNGYERASTNEIVKEAGISKGSLFVYFNNKKELYLFLLDYAAKVINKIYGEVDWGETDVFERMKALGLAKFKTYKSHPQAFNFLKATAYEDSGVVKAEVRKLTNTLIAEGLEKGYKDIDRSKFCEDIDINKALDIISWTMLGFAEQKRDGVNSIDDVDLEILEEANSYFEILQRCFYKKEQ